MIRALIAITLFTIGTSLSLAQYKEDLSMVRPTFEMEETVDTVEEVEVVPVTPTKHANDQVEENLDRLAETYGTYTKTHGYRVQIYSGTSFEDAETIRQTVKKLLKSAWKEEGKKGQAVPEIYQLYDAPLFRVRIGDYVRREEAYRMLYLLSEEFENALIVPDKILLDKIR